jgi:hypothetical protein
MKRSHMVALLVAATRQEIIYAHEIDNERWLIDSYLTGGFVGYDNMTDDELRLELNELKDGEYSGWDEETFQIISYVSEDGEWKLVHEGNLEGAEDGAA